MFYTYDEVIKIVMIEQINIVFKGFNLVASNKEICKENFINILQKICEIVKSTPIIYYSKKLFRFVYYNYHTHHPNKTPKNH